MAVQIVYSAVLSIFRKCHQTFFALENIYRVNCHNENMRKPFHSLVHKQWCQDFSSWWHWHFHWHEYLLLRNELSILSKWHAFAGYQLGFAVCTNCFEKCINCCANVNSDVRNAPKRLRKTVIYINGNIESSQRGIRSVLTAHAQLLILYRKQKWLVLLSSLFSRVGNRNELIIPNLPYKHVYSTQIVAFLFLTMYTFANFCHDG